MLAYSLEQWARLRSLITVETVTGTAAATGPAAQGDAFDGQRAVPASVVSAGSWTPSIVGADLAALLADNDDATYIESSPGAGDDVIEFALSAIEAPGAGPVSLRIRAEAA